MNFDHYHNIYFIGIGGIGMSALARYFYAKGCQVAGYDRVKSDITKQLSKQGIHIHYKADVEQLPEQVDLVVYTPAIPDDHKELSYYRNSKTPVKKRAEVLEWITRDRETIAIAGSHGKTSVSALTAHLLQTGGVNCTAFIGGITLNYHSNFIQGNDKTIVVEADEFDRSFLRMQPDVAVVTAVDDDHLDVYGSTRALYEAFETFLKQVKQDGKIIVHRTVLDKLKLKKSDLPNVSTYALSGKADLTTDQIQVEQYEDESRFMFSLNADYGSSQTFVAPMPGEHNIENALAAVVVARQFNVPWETIGKGLKNFKGIQRRFQFQIRAEDIIYIDDYAHHPEEVKVTIQTAKKLYPGKKITVVFQPHLYSRTRDFAEAFGKSLEEADEVILLPIYPAREKLIEGVGTELIYEHCEHPDKKLFSKKELLHELERDQFEVLLTLGAGDIDELVQPIKEKLSS